MKAITKIIGLVSIVLISFSGSAQEVKKNIVPIRKSVEKQDPVNISPKLNKTTYSKVRPLKPARKVTSSVKQISVKE